MKNAHIFARPALAIAALSIVGCAALDLSTMLPWSVSKAEKVQPARMTVAWTQKTHQDTGKPLMRGFQAQIMFFEKPASGSVAKGKKVEDKVMKVEGMVTVYAFDESAGSKSSARPKTTVFNDQQLKKSLNNSKEPPSYTVWVPWDAVGNPPRQVRLLVRFDAADGGPVLMSQASRHQLQSDPDANRLTSRSGGKRTVALPVNQTTLTEP